MSWSFADPLAAENPQQAFERLFFELSQRIRLLIIIVERFLHRRVNVASHAYSVDSAPSSA